MNAKLSDIAKRLNEHLSEADKAFREQQKELELTRLERDIYKEILKNTDKLYTTDGISSQVYAVIYSIDNGEGVDTDTCIGVFTKKTKALKALVDVCKNNTELDVNGFNIVPFNVGKEVQTEDIVYVIQCDEEAHCEISTSVIDVKCDAKDIDYNDCYSVEIVVDKVYDIE